ncbi:MAG: hypothetical protein CMB99_00575 [Flavobacteriaceae bacterium]|nr:hypothetical protein [Flavobacteriaceae bacterium]
MRSRNSSGTRLLQLVVGANTLVDTHADNMLRAKAEPIKRDFIMSKLPSVTELHELFTLDLTTGRLFWKEREDNPQFNAKFAGKEAGSVDERGYVRVQIGRGNVCLAHRIIYKMVEGEEPVMLDHINRDKSDNRLTNLRAANNSINKRNQGRTSANSSGCVGVYYVKSRDKWLVRSPKVDGKTRYCGHFDSREEAIAHRVKLFGESACF